MKDINSIRTPIIEVLSVSVLLLQRQGTPPIHITFKNSLSIKRPLHCSQRTNYLQIIKRKTLLNRSIRCQSTIKSALLLSELPWSYSLYCFAPQIS